MTAVQRKMRSIIRRRIKQGRIYGVVLQLRSAGKRASIPDARYQLAKKQLEWVPHFVY